MIKNNRYDLGMTTLAESLLKPSFNIPPAVLEEVAASVVVDKVCSLVAAAMPGMPVPDSTFALAAHAYLYQDEDAHETCSLTACLNPLHPGPCKGWKGTLFKTSESAYHALEAARVEKANANRLKKIQALKDAGKPIPKKLLQPIVAKPHPHAGKTANAATGEAHAAGQAVTEAAGVHVQTPGKVTLGQAVKLIKATDATKELGPKGKKPTVASKGIAAVIAQEKVTPTYKLNKAEAITPEQWNALSHDEKAIIRGELTKIENEGFGPQQKKATELLAKLTIEAPKPVLTPAQIAAHQALYGPGGSTEKKIAALTGLTPEEFKSLAPKEQGKVIKELTSLYQYNPDLRKTVAEAMVKYTDGSAKAMWEKQAAKPAYTPTMTQVGKHLLESGTLGKSKASTQERLDTYKALTPEEFGNLSKQEQAFVLHELNGMLKQAGKNSKIDGPGVQKALDKLTGKPDVEAKVESPAAKPLSEKAKKVKELVDQGSTLLDAISKVNAEAKVAETKAPAAPKLGDLPNAASPLGTQKLIKQHGSLDVTYAKGSDYEKHFADVGLKGNGAHEHYLVNEGAGNWYITDKDGKKLQFLSKSSGVHLSKSAEKPETPKIENAAPSAPEKPAALPKHVQHAIDMATGKAPGASWSKNHLAAYEKLTPEEFAALPPDIQSKVIQELKKGATKFLDPKKIQATSELLKKFKGGLEASKPAAPSEPGFHSHINDHSVTDAQAKKLAAGQPVATHAAVAKELAGLDLADQPDVMAHHNEAKAYGANLLTSLTKDEPAAALKDPAVQQAAQDVLDAATTLKQGQLVGQAKKNAYNKIDKTLKGDTGQLSPIQKASLAEYQKYLLAHPTKTEPEDITKLQTATIDAIDKLREALKAAKTPKPDEMTPAQLDSKISELLGPEAVKPQVNLTMAELKEANATGAAMAKLGTEKYSPATLENPEVAAKMKAVAQMAGQLAATGENKKKLQAHLNQYHYHALNSHEAGVGYLNAPQLAAVKAHAEKIKKEFAYLDEVTKQQQDKLIAARKEFDKVAEEVHAAGVPKVELTDYDQQTISEAFGNNWGKAASKAVTYGLKTYSDKLKMKEHPEYTPFTQDLGNLQTAVKNLALAHAAEHVADLNVPIDPDTGAKIPGPEKDAWTNAALARMKAEQQYNQLFKTAQTRLDKIRTDIGLKKRALPKIDSPAIKAAAAESGYYKTAGYNGPNYGKQAKAKNYILAKVGPKLGIVHQSASEKKAEKAAAEAAKLKAAHPEFYAKKEADKAAAAAKPKVSVDDAGKTPNQAAAEKYGWKFVPSTGSPLGDWSYSSGGAYYANADHLKEAQDILSGPDVQYGLAAQKQFKWSINNMESKGASHSWKQSLYGYTGSGYDDVNTKLNSLPPGVTKTGSTTISNIDNGMAASPELEADTVLYRGFKSPHTVFASGKWNDTNVAGMEWSQRSYSSTSGALSTAEGFAGWGGVVMRIIIPKGMKVHGINAKGGMHPGENEIILQRGLRYRVVADYGKHGSDGKRYIDVMVVPNPYAKPE